MNLHSCYELYLGMLPLPMEKKWESNQPVQKEGVPANMCLKDPENMDLECFLRRWIETILFYIYLQFLLPNSIVFAYSQQVLY